MLQRVVLIGAGVLALGLIAASPVSAQAIVVTPTPRTAHIGMSPYMRIPIGSRAEAAQLKADQDAARLASQPKKKGKGR